MVRLVESEEDALLVKDSEVDVEDDIETLVVEDADPDSLCELAVVMERLTVADDVGVGGGVTVDEMLPDWDGDSDVDCDCDCDVEVVKLLLYDCDVLVVTDAEGLVDCDNETLTEADSEGDIVVD